MRFMFFKVLAFVLIWPFWASAQSLTISTVERPPFSMNIDGAQTGFSIDLWQALSETIGQEFTITRHDRFSDMLDSVQNGEADAAIANISITSAREAKMDFSHPIFESGLQIMTQKQASTGPSIWRAVASVELVLAVLAAFAMLLAGGMLMWRFERRAQPYFDRSASDALFPSFWWALNLVVNGGFEERVPRTVFGRLFGVLLVISSLFIVSIFVAHITSAMTVEAINGSVNSFNDLYGKQVGTIENSTSASFMERRDLDYVAFTTLDDLLAAFEAQELDAVVFDAPVLAYYIATETNSVGELAGAVFMRENYGIALPSGSALVEDVNQALLTLRENGEYEEIYRKWFGKSP
ncbi:hypothetical protein SuNHUV7_12860 (plasmid) [Pseudoseohaeicola sp. NH-UV-7]|uniref:transporter substrate-binding domain-containing protein n=1 Tax=Sulfitobacter sp. TBRI5 TaxID=2989732 RepID=UPI003A61831C